MKPRVPGGSPEAWGERATYTKIEWRPESNPKGEETRTLIMDYSIYILASDLSKYSLIIM